MSDKNDKLSEGCLVMLTGLLIFCVGWPWGGYAFSYSWNTLIAPFGLPVIGILQAMGIVLVGRYIAWQPQPENEDEDSTVKIIKAAAITFLRPLFLILFTWILTCFMT